MNPQRTSLLSVWMLLAVSPLAAQTEVKDSAINHAPEDVVFFYSVMNLQATLERTLASDLVTDLRQIPGAAETFEGLDLLLGVDPPSAEIDEETAPLLTYRSAISNLLGSEVFVYAERSLLDLNRHAQQMMRLAKEAAKQDENYRSETFFMSLPDEEIAKLVVPSFVIGTRLKDVAAGADYLDFCQMLATSYAADWMQPHIRQELVDGQPVVWVTLDGSMIPWDDEVEAGEDEIATQASLRLRRLVADRTITLAVGVRDGFLLISFGEDLGPLRRFKGEKTLYASEAAQRLRAADLSHPLAIGYRSDDWATSLTATDYSLVQWFTELIEANQGIVSATDPSVQFWIQENLKKLGQTLAELDRQWKAIRLPTVGKLGWWFVDGQGIAGETVHHGRIDRRVRNGIPAVLDHVGPKPLVVAASSGQVDKRQWSIVTNLLRTGVQAANAYYQTVVGMIESNASEVDDETMQQSREIATNAEEIANVLTKVLDTFDSDWLDANGDEGWAFVLTREPEGKQWPINFGWIGSVSDAPALQTAAESLRTQLNAAFERYAAFVSDEESTEVPIAIPAAIVKVDDVGTRATWAWADAGLAPQALLTNEWLMLGIDPDVLTKFIEVSPHDQLPMLPDDATVVGYLHLNFREYIDALTPALEAGQQGDLVVGLLGPFPIPIDTSLIEGDDLTSDDESTNSAMSPEEVKQIIAIAKSVHHFTRVTTVEDLNTVVRWRLQVER